MGCLRDFTVQSTRSFKLVERISKFRVPGLGGRHAAGGTKGDSNLPFHLATIRPIRTYVRLVRTNGNAGSRGDVLRICPNLISRPSPFEVNLKCFTYFESSCQVSNRKRLPFP